MMEFHIARKARERYQFAESLFSYSGNVVFANVSACREFAYRINKVRDAERHPELAVHAGQLYAMGLIDEASHVLMARYREKFDPAVMTSALDWFSGVVGAEPLGRLLLTFVEEFPGISVMRGHKTAREWLSGATDGNSHWAVALEELLLLWTANRNEAFQPFEELFEEKTLAERTVYRQVTQSFPEYFATRPLIPLPNAKAMNLLDLLRAPAVGAPRSLSEQLALIRSLWKPLLGDSLEHYLLIAAEILHEEELAIWMQFNPPAAQAREAARRHRESGQKQWPSVVSTAQVPVFGDPAHEYEKFSPDMAWMPTAVLIAKSTYVWMAQMSRQYGRAITRLDEIPDEELALLAARGMNSLWLIGVWERSRASKTIKQLCGNTDAVASAYSLYDYAIAEDLGGEAAYVNLRDRAYRQGIRLASDMVPNHMGIDSPWVVEHPEWFISRPESPYPVYSFNGPDLSHDARVEIKIEDHYYEESDAAVVFRRRDRQSNDVRYIYHGNDGTSFPWNDTAQLDYLNPAVREQVIQTILHVARLFPVIRFDAAMTLAKRHFHRLWFPGPGASGAIPSRAEYGMSQAEFDRAMPQEFWREVVDRVAAEVPGTLLLAEAFWLMEGYFVRTLGMHRVYNSAFMVMLRDEDNAKYRSVIKNTLEFDPDVLKRYVNFMSNPDERTAIDQFGKGDKCFGVAAMMATLPGLPMFGHGQIEGFTEKYGMEYQRPRYDENADPWMVERHEREIAPLLKRRRLFAESDNFLLYDFYLDSGRVDENVFAYSNRSGNARALVVFNNRYAQTRGTIDWSAAYADKGASQLRRQRIREGLGLRENSGTVLAWRDSLTGLQYLRRASDLAERGLTLELYAYQCHVFLDWQELYATTEKPWDRLCDLLNGRGVDSLEDALVKLELQPAHDALLLLLEPSLVRKFAGLAEHPRTVAGGANLEIEAERSAFFEDAWTRCASFLREAQKAYVGLIGAGAAQPANPGLLRAAYRERLRAAMRIPAIESLFPAPWTVAARRVLPSPSPQLTATAMWGPVLGWCALELLAESIDAEKPEQVALDLFDRLRLREPFAQAFNGLGYEGEEGWRIAARVKVVLLTGAEVGRPSIVPEEAAPALWPALWLDPDVRWLTGVHEAEGHDYLVRERYEELLWWLLLPPLLRLAGENGPGRIAGNRAAVRAMSKGIEEALEAAKAADYRVEPLAGPAVEEAVEHEIAVVVKAAEELKSLVIVEPELNEPEIEATAEPAAEVRITEAGQPSPSEEPEPSEPEKESAVAATVESGIEPEPEDEGETKPAEEVEAAEEREKKEEKGGDFSENRSSEDEAPVDSVEELMRWLVKPAAAANSSPTEETQALHTEQLTEPEVEAETEPAAEAKETVAEQAVFTGQLKPAEPEIEAATATVSEPEKQEEAALLRAEEQNPSEPVKESAVEATVETGVEPEPVEEVEAQAERIAEPLPKVESNAELELVEQEAAAEEIPIPTEAPEPAETEMEAETAAEAETAEEEAASAGDEPKATEPEIEAAVDAIPEAGVEAEAASAEAETLVAETNLAAEPAEHPETPQPEVKTETESAVVTESAEAETEVEAEAGAAKEEEPGTGEEHQATEPEIATGTESVLEAGKETALAATETETKLDVSTGSQPSPSKDEEAAGPEIARSVEPLPEAASVPQWVVVEAQPAAIEVEANTESASFLPASLTSPLEPPDDSSELMHWLLKPTASGETSPRAIHVARPPRTGELAEPGIKPEIEAESVSAEPDTTIVKSLLSFYQQEPALPQYRVEPKTESQSVFEADTTPGPVFAEPEEEADEPLLPVEQTEQEPEFEVEIEPVAEAAAESELEPVEAATAEEKLADEPETESESPESYSSETKSLVDSIVSIFGRRSSSHAEVTTLGLSDLTHSSTESWEPPEPENKPAAKVEPEPLPATAEIPATPEPFEPPAPKIEFAAKSPREVETEHERPAAAPPAANKDPENKPPVGPVIDPHSLLKPERRKNSR